MAQSDLVVSAFNGLRDSLSKLSVRSAHPADRNSLLNRAAVCGSLADQCEGRYAGRDVVNGGAAIDLADAATKLAEAADENDHAAVLAVLAATERANASLSAIVGKNDFGASLSDAFVGSLRITPSRSALARAGGNFAAAAAEKPKAATPGYVTDVAKLFPVEAATLFPLGQSIAANDPETLLLIILVTALFVVALRYFATQEDGKASWNEIGGALVSFLLWVGATKGYWVAGIGILPAGLGAEKGAAVYGFVTVMWVALAPYLVKEKAKRDASAKGAAA